MIVHILRNSEKKTCTMQVSGSEKVANLFHERKKVGISIFFNIYKLYTQSLEQFKIHLTYT